jgi:hypothetical protein
MPKSTGLGAINTAGGGIVVGVVEVVDVVDVVEVVDVMEVVGTVVVVVAVEVVVMVAAMPTRGTVKGVPAKVPARVAERTPVALGVKRTYTTHDPLGGRGTAEHVVLGSMAKSAALGPVIDNGPTT